MHGGAATSMATSTAITNICAGVSPRAFHRKMCSGQEVAGHAGFYVMVQYSVSQLCNELQKLESWSAADP